MEMVRVGIVYEPRLYGDLIAQVFDGVRPVTIVEPPFSAVDVVVFPLADSGHPDMDMLPGSLPEGAKLVAVSPGLDRGLVRLPGADKWEEVRPFGLDHIFSEVLAGRERPVIVTYEAPPPARPAVRAKRRRFKWPAWPQPAPARQWAVAFAVLVALISISISSMAVSAQSLPGEPLYSVKRLAESVQLALAPPASKPDVHATRAQRRLEEIAALAARGIPISEVVEDLDRELQAALDTAQDLPEAEQEALLARLVVLTQDHNELLQGIATRQSDHALVVQELENAMQVLADRRVQAQDALDTVVVPVPATPPTEPAQPVPTHTSPGLTPTPQPPGQTPLPPGATSTPPPPPPLTQAPELTGTQTSAPTQTPELTSTRTEAPPPTQTPELTSTQTEAPPPTQTPELTSTQTETLAPTHTPEPTPQPAETSEPPGPTHTPQPPG